MVPQEHTVALWPKKVQVKQQGVGFGFTQQALQPFTLPLVAMLQEEPEHCAYTTRARTKVMITIITLIFSFFILFFGFNV